ncbi:hypothetical protein PRUPE_1G453800, partial [Prunus persica]
LALVAAALPLVPQLLYWNSILPNKPMPKALSELVQPGLSLYLQPQTQESSLIPPFYLGTLSDQPLTVSYQKDDVAATDNVFFGYNQDAATAAADKLFFGHNQNVVTAADNIFFGDNHEAAVGNQLLKDPTQEVFFLEKDVQPGTTMKYSLARNSTRATFLHRKTAESIPFSSTKLPDILNQLSLVKPILRGEERYCATSLESMVDFTTSKLGRNIQAISAEVERKGATMLQKYTIKPGVKKLAGKRLIDVFYCHAMGKTRAYMVPLEGADGTSAKAIVVCHVDTSVWHPKNFSLQALNCKPGTVPVCHFLPDAHIACLPN